MICFCYEHKLRFAKGTVTVTSRYTTSYVTKMNSRGFYAVDEDFRRIIYEVGGVGKGGRFLSPAFVSCRNIANWESLLKIVWERQRDADSGRDSSGTMNRRGNSGGIWGVQMSLS